jgi:hypothetical protein
LAKLDFAEAGALQVVAVVVVVVVRHVTLVRHFNYVYF